MPDIQDQECRDRDVGGEELARELVGAVNVREEDLEAVGEREQDQEAEREVGGVGLPEGLVEANVQGVLALERGVEARVGEEEGDPGDEARVWVSNCEACDG